MGGVRGASAALLIAWLLAAFPGGAPARAAAGEANVTDEGAGQAGAAVCQVALYWRAILVVEPEDRLGLAVPLRESGAGPMGEGAQAARAGCEVAIGLLSLRAPARADGLRPTLVTGPPGVPTGGKTGGEPVAGASAVCRHVVLVETVVIGGGAAGLPTGRFGPVLSHGDGPSDPAAAVRCHSQVEWVSIRPGGLYQKVDARTRRPESGGPDASW